MGQNLWEVVAGTEKTPPPKENAEALWKWRNKAVKAMFVLTTTIEEDLVEHIRYAETPNETWETFAKLFSKKNKARFQLLEKELVEALPKKMGDITLEEKDAEDALFIKKMGPLRGQGEAKKWTRGGSRCPKKSSYSRGAQQESSDEDDEELVKNERRIRDLIEGETPSNNIEEEEEEEEWDAEGGFSMKVRDPDTSEGSIVFGCDSDEDWEALRDEEEDIKDKKIEPSLYDDEEPQEYSEDRHGALVIHEDLEEHDKAKKIPEGRSCEDLSHIMA
uniref:Uncharacterized protein n=1 Tax=Setaria viridis TaxID=4556 RepID=A0A4V6D2J4_SETVI|nr:hypothetical protein SEVIR_9G562800v2 [Setaria viridis]